VRRELTNYLVKELCGPYVPAVLQAGGRVAYHLPPPERTDLAWNSMCTFMLPASWLFVRLDPGELVVASCKMKGELTCHSKVALSYDRPPADPKQLMADFYAAQFLSAGGDRQVPGHRRDQLDYELDQVNQTLIPYLREHLLDKAGYSIVCELRHLFDCANPAGETTPLSARKWLSWLRQQLQAAGASEEFARLLESHGLRNARPPEEQVTGEDKRAAARAGVRLFHCPDVFWDEWYGGEPWALACKTWLQLYHATRLPEQAIYCDKLYSCEHNSGSLLDKNPGYDSKWLKYLLDRKRDAQHPEELLRFASPFLRRLGQLMTREKYGRGWDHDRFGAERSEVLEFATLLRLGKQLATRLRPLFSDVQVYPQASAEVVGVYCYHGPHAVARLRMTPGTIEILNGTSWRVGEIDLASSPDPVAAVVAIARRM